LWVVFFAWTQNVQEEKNDLQKVGTSRNHVICNHSLCDYVWLNVTYDNEWWPMQLIFKFGWILIFLSTKLWLWPISSFNRLIFQDVFVFFTTSYIRLVAHVTKIVTSLLHKVCMLLNSYMYRLFNSTNVLICIYIPTKYLPPYLISTYLLPTYLFIIN
jgi:hypothetical protein